MFAFLYRSQIPGVRQDRHQALITPWRRRYQVECQAEFYSSPLSLSWECWHFQVGGLLSVDGTFKSITKNWAQLFIIMCEHQGVHIPVAMAWLQDKTTLSYYTLHYSCYSTPSANTQRPFRCSVDLPTCNWKELDVTTRKPYTWDLGGST